MNLFIISILIVALLVCFYIIRNLVKKIEVLEDNMDELAKEVQLYDAFYDDLRTRVNESVTRMRQIDRIGSFEADDETGYVFKELKGIVESLNTRF